MCRKNGKFLAWVSIIVGALILLGLVLPRWLWWLVCGSALLVGGIIIVKK